jgi:hypothetical protein
MIISSLKQYKFMFIYDANNHTLIKLIHNTKITTFEELLYKATGHDEFILTS